MRRTLSCLATSATVVAGVTEKTRPPFCERMSETNMVPPSASVVER